MLGHFDKGINKINHALFTNCALTEMEIYVLLKKLYSMYVIVL